ncbi:TIGR02302 family protein [Litoreibacter roseus]|nr:TIGR02302 family protein [Litoreibacter roseus]
MTTDPRVPDVSALKWPLRLTWVGLTSERLVRAFWPLAAVVMVVFAAIAFDLQSALSLEGVWVVTLASGAALIAALLFGLRTFRLPARGEALDRLDRSMAGRPISAALDTQAIGDNDPQSQAVWDAHVRRMEARLSEAEAVSPDLRLSSRDPYALRYAALLAFVVALGFGSIWRAGSLSDLSPQLAGEAVAAGPAWEAWIEPPRYTDKPTLYLNEVTRDQIAVPVGSQLTVRLYGQIGDLGLSETVSGRIPPAETGEDEAPQTAFSLPIEQNGTVAIEGTDESWDITATADAPPKVWFQGLIDRSPNGDMRMSFNASDDYAVAAGNAKVELNLDQLDRRYGLAVDPEPREGFTLDLPMPLSGDRANFSETLIENLAQHPWANLDVRFNLTVRDDADQISEIEVIETELPGRRFFQPIAKAVVEQRRDLLWSRENATRVSQVLRAITYEPDGFFPNEQAYLTLRMAITRLDLAREYDGLDVEKQEELAEMLWQAAILLEEGRLSDALERLRQAQEKLSDAMRNGATDEEIAELMQELNEAMRDYMQQLAQEGQQGEQQQAQNQQGQEVTEDQLQQMLDEIQRLMEEGRMDEAEQLLSQLMEMMQNMQVAQGQPGQGQQGEGQQAMEGLQDTLREQQGLSDEAFRDLQEQFNPGAQAGESQGNEGRNGGQGRGQDHEGQSGQGQPQDQQQGEGGEGNQQAENEGPGGGSLADRQRELRNELSRQSQNLPGTGTPEGDAAREALGRAGEAMDRAEEALRDDQTAEALGAQSDAMEALRDGLRSLGDALAQEQQQQGGQQGQQAGQPSRQQRDPLGREAGSDGMIGSQDNMLQSEDARRRSRDLLDEIRRRSGEQERPEVERDYLKRLLDRF